MTYLSMYRESDVVEKGLDILKNDLQALPLNAKTESTIRGLLFYELFEPHRENKTDKPDKRDRIVE